MVKIPFGCHTPSDHVLPMRGEDRLILRSFIYDGPWVVVWLISANVFMFFCVLTKNLLGQFCTTVDGGMFILIVWIPIVLAIRTITDRIRCQLCGSDGFRALLSTYEGRHTLVRADDLYAKRMELVMGEHASVEAVRMRWYKLLVDERVLYRKQLALIDDWVRDRASKRSGADQA